MPYCNISLGQRQLIYDKVFSLKQSGLSYKKIIEQILSEFKIKLHKSMLSYWFNNDVKLIGGENNFEKKPSPELSYVLGVLFGDGAITFNKKKQDYAIRLEAKDKDFVENFSACVSKALNKNRNYLVCRTGRGMYSVKGRSKQLYFFIKAIKEDFELLKKFVEPFPAEFIRGLADSEGCPSVKASDIFSVNVTVAYSANVLLLDYVKYLLENRFEIESKLYLHKKKGESDSIINGRLLIRTKNVYVLVISKFKYVARFANLINFSINRKHQKLKDAILIYESYGRILGTSIWGENYVKIGRIWFPFTNSVI